MESENFNGRLHSDAIADRGDVSNADRPTAGSYQGGSGGPHTFRISRSRTRANDESHRKAYALIPGMALPIRPNVADDSGANPWRAFKAGDFSL